MLKGEIMLKTVFNRVEKKYLLNEDDYQKIKEVINKHMTLDKYDKYSLYNIYYDNENDLLIRKSLEKPLYKEKLRVRSYYPPSNNDQVFVEIKKKYQGVVNKRRIIITKEEADLFLNQHQLPNNHQITKEIDYLVKKYQLIPKLFLAYDRIAYASDDDFRVTFDNNIRYRTHDLDLSNCTYDDKLLNDNEYLMEVKCHNSYPLWFSNILTKYQIYPCSFSKYGNIYLKLLKERMIKNV